GKTTFINLLTGKLVPDAGRVAFAGSDVTRLPTSARVRAGMSRTFQVTNIFPRLSTEVNVAVPLLAMAGRALHPLRRLDSIRDVHQAALRLLGEVGLEGRAQAPAAELSHGDRRLLEIALALATSPRLLLLDEPTAGIGSGERERVLGRVRQLAAGGKLTIVLIEHDMEIVFGLASRIVVLHQGKVIADGPPQAIREDARVRDIYLGEANLSDSVQVSPLSAAGAALSAPSAAPSPEGPPLAAAGAPLSAPGAAISAAGAPLLEVDRLNAGYGLAHVLHDVSFSVARGEMVALLGRNGAGK